MTAAGAAVAELRGAVPWGDARREVRLLLRAGHVRWLLGLAAALPVAYGALLHAGVDGVPLAEQVRGSGAWLGVAALAGCTPLPWAVAVGVLAGPAVAARVRDGQARTLLGLGMPRRRAVGLAFWPALAALLLAALVVWGVGTVVGLATSGGQVPVTLDGRAVGLPAFLGRGLLAAGDLTLVGCGCLALGVFVSTLVDVPVLAVVLAAAVPLLSEAVRAGTSGRWAGLLPTGGWDDPLWLAGLSRPPWGTLVDHAVVATAWTAGALALAASRMEHRDLPG
ncbi:MAG: transporter permease [Mycobacterium sp.]|nr:transporter permease [Mycobacterium sp.]